MPRLDWKDVPDPDAYALVPADEYACRVHACTSDGLNEKEIWTVVWEITEGHLIGQRFIDRMYFSERAVSRVKLLCSRLKIPTEGAVNLLARHLINRECFVDVRVEEFRGEDQNKVSYAGFRVRETWQTPANEHVELPPALSGEQPTLATAPPLGGGVGTPGAEPKPGQPGYVPF